MSPGSLPRLVYRPASVMITPATIRTIPAPISIRPMPMVLGERAASMLTDENLEDAMCDQLVQRQQFLIRLPDSRNVLHVRYWTTGVQRLLRFGNDRVSQEFPCHLPQRNEPVN